MAPIQKLPTIEIELRKSIILNEMMKGSWGVNYASPIEQELLKKNDFKVLDVGCGTGTFLSQLSKDYPSAKFVGLDIAPKLFPNGHLQDNLQFVKGDILEGLPFEDDSFDFVYMGFLLWIFTEEQWNEQVIKELIRVCKPGGWVEILDVEEVKSLSPTSNRLVTSVNMSILGSNGISVINEEDIPESLNYNDQIDKVYSDERLNPIGNWGGYLGELALEMFTLTLNQRSDHLSNRLGVSGKEFDTMIEQFMRDVEYYHSYFISVRICCQKIM